VSRRQRPGARVEEIVGYIKSRGVAVIRSAAVLEPGTEQQFVSVHLLAAVENRLPGNETSWAVTDVGRIGRCGIRVHKGRIGNSSKTLGPGVESEFPDAVTCV
jgi:hypothetical protein